MGTNDTEPVPPSEDVDGGDGESPAASDDSVADAGAAVPPDSDSAGTDAESEATEESDADMEPSEAADASETPADEQAGVDDAVESPDPDAEPAPLVDDVTVQEALFSAQSEGAQITTEELDILMPESIDDTTKVIVDEIARLSEALDSMRDVALDEVKKSASDNADRVSTLGASLDEIMREFRSVRADIVETGRTAQYAADAATRYARESRDVAENNRQQIRQLHDRFGASAAGGSPIFSQPIVLVAGSVILLTWSIVLYFKGGNLLPAIVGVALANLAGCAMLLHSNTGR